jgi:hypothetical protein
MSTSTQLANRSTKLLASSLDYFLIDGSGSMQSKWWDTLAALDNFTLTLRAAHADPHGVVSVFAGGDIQMLQRDGLLSGWKKFTEEPLGSTWGGTPLYDAILLMGQHLRDLDPPTCSIVIVTDGHENMSHTSSAQAAGVLDWCRAKGWFVTFLGADFNNSKQARLLGANDSNAIGVQQKLLPEAGRLLGKKRLSGDMDFTPGEKKQFGGYLTDQSGAGC